MRPAERHSVSFTKWGGRPHWHFDVDYLADDDHGRWFLGRPGILLQRGDEPPILERDGFAMLVPAVGDWIAFWNVDDEFEVYIDISREVSIRKNTIMAIDMDLDVVRRRDGTVEVLDEDEFEEHGRLYAYPSHAIADARALATDLVAAVSASTGPFGDIGASRLCDAQARWARVAE